jgi:4-hydroxy-4-methyl-2-oxoglutarate aldolase
MSTRPDNAQPGVLQRLARVDTTSLVDAGRGLRVLPAALWPVRRGLRLVGRALTVEPGRT